MKSPIRSNKFALGLLDKYPEGGLRSFARLNDNYYKLFITSNIESDVKWLDLEVLAPIKYKGLRLYQDNDLRATFVIGVPKEDDLFNIRKTGYLYLVPYAKFPRYLYSNFIQESIIAIFKEIGCKRINIMVKKLDISADKNSKVAMRLAEDFGFINLGKILGNYTIHDYYIYERYV